MLPLPAKWTRPPGEAATNMAAQDVRDPAQLTDLARGGEGTLVKHGSGLAGPGVALYAADAVIFRENEPDGVPASHCRRTVSERLVHGAVAAPQQNSSKTTR